MGNSLKDQLLKAGLVNEKQVKKATKEKQKESMRQHGQGKSEAGAEDMLRAQREKQEKIERDRLLNRQRQLEAEKKAAAAQVRQLVEQNRQPTGEGDAPYNFVDRGKVKRLYVSDKVRHRLVAGQLAVVRLEKEYLLVPSEVAEKIKLRDAGFVIAVNEEKNAETMAENPEDPYANFKVPDDLMW